MTSELIDIILIYLLAINLIALLVYGIDKIKAKKSWWRISEFNLLALALMGGSLGAWVGMELWHHKTKHKKFKYGVPLILIIQLSLVAYALHCAVAEQTAFNFFEFFKSFFIKML